MQLCYFCLEEERGKGCRYNTTNLMAHGSSWLLYRCWWVVVWCYKAYISLPCTRQMQPNIKWNTNWSARTKHTLYLINTHNNFHSSLSAFKYCRVYCRIYAEDNHCIRIHTQPHSDTHRFKLKLFYVALLRKLYQAKYCLFGKQYPSVLLATLRTQFDPFHTFR